MPTLKKKTDSKMGQVNLLKNEKNKFLEKKLDFEFIIRGSF